MNELFVNIKVDREERPDLDKIYQTAHQILAQRPGGWPLNMFLTPHDRMPFFGGTYFPKTARHGMPAFTELLQRVAEFYRDKREAVLAQNDQVREIFTRLQPAGPAPGQHIAPAVLEQAVAQLQKQYEPRHGGFGRAPKFPHPTSLETCLRAWARSRANHREQRRLLDIARHSLAAMAQGGIYDQVGGGFCRYSVDEEWMIPHFEKMLYDNGQLQVLYADAFAATGEELFRRTAIGIGEWVMREMQSPEAATATSLSRGPRLDPIGEGGYYSSLDADSEGHEGKYYVWDNADLESLLDKDEWALVEARYGLKGEPNFEGRWHLHTRLDNATLAAQWRVPESNLQARLASAHAKLLAARERRVRPGRDDKILTSWNALMIKGMARAAWRLERPDFLASAQRAFDFLRQALWKDGRLLATYKDGKAHLNAYLDDYVFLMDAGLELMQAQWRDEDLAFVLQLAEAVLEHFEDETRGGFWFTGDHHEPLVYRPKPASDDAIPSGNGVAAQVFARLGHLLGDANLLHSAERTLEGLYGSIAEHPSSHGSLLTAIDEYLTPTQTIVLRGELAAVKPWQERARSGYCPWRLTVAIPPNADLPDGLRLRQAGDKVTAYVCRGHACEAPLTDLDSFAQALAPDGAAPLAVSH
jgi:hypothetical protein